jgi:putative sterol carrier protein
LRGSKSNLKRTREEYKKISREWEKTEIGKEVIDINRERSRKRENKWVEKRQVKRRDVIKKYRKNVKEIVREYNIIEVDLFYI